MKHAYIEPNEDPGVEFAGMIIKTVAWTFPIGFILFFALLWAFPAKERPERQEFPIEGMREKKG